MDNYYFLHEPGLWGDFGTLLIGGIASRRDDGYLELSRTGPLVPPLTIHHCLRTIVISDALLAMMTSIGLRLPAHREVIKAHIAEFNWAHWNRAAPLPHQELPPMQEVEDLILGLPNSPAVSANMGTLWEMELPILVNCWIINELDPRTYDVVLLPPWNRLNELDIFCCSRNEIVVTERAKLVLEQYPGLADWVCFKRTLRADDQICLPEHGR